MAISLRSLFVLPTRHGGYERSGVARLVAGRWVSCDRENSVL